MTVITSAPTIIRVSAKSHSAAVAGAIAGVMRDCGHVDIQAIGAEAVNQMVKAIAVARTFLAEDGIALTCAPLFVQVEIDGGRKTAVRFSVERSKS